MPPSSPFWAFGQGWIDPGTHRYYLADATNRRVDVVDTRTNQLIMTIGGFTGVSGLVGDSRRIGPAGLAGDQHGHLFVGDGNSTLKIIDLASHHIQTVSTGGQGRVNALAYDPDRHLVLATNSADVPPFVSVIDTQAHQLLGRLVLPFATAGVEQPVFEQGTFLLAIPQTRQHPQGEIAVMRVDHAGRPYLAERHPIPLPCRPNGLAMGQRHQLLLGCAVGHPLVMDITSWRIRAVMSSITGETDEVWYNPTDQRFFTATAVRTAHPIVAVIDARTDHWLTSIPTVPSAHSVAVDPVSRHVFVPMAGRGIGVFEPFVV
jgi:DNA-binding beta-propeller fold protein YncE